jgi:uncharacterized protein
MRLQFLCASTLVFLFVTPSPTYGQSFNCITADRPDEVLICQSDRLSRLDERMSSLYFTLRNTLRGLNATFLRRVSGDGCNHASAAAATTNALRIFTSGGSDS